MAGYNPYNSNFYMQDLQAMKDRIDRTMQQYQHQQYQNQYPNQMMPQQPQVTQNFQLAPMQNTSDLTAKIVAGIEDVKNTFVMQNGIFVNKEMNTLWTKNVSGDIKTYTLTEVIELDPKDIEINNLKQEIQNMRMLIANQTKQQSSIINNQSEIQEQTKIDIKNEKKNK